MECLCNHKSIILVYMILNSKGDLIGCGLHGYSPVSFFFLIGQCNIAVGFKNNILALVIYGNGGLEVI